MTANHFGIVLWFVVAWPLLLAVPAVHTRLPWPRHLGLAPIVLLFILPGDFSHVFPWILFGSGLAINTEVRWLLVMFAVIWFTAASIVKSSQPEPTQRHVNTFFLLTLAGNLGVVLSADLVSFFSFATLMGYSFYGLMLRGSDAEIRRAGRRYLVFLIVADLALFEALLLAAATTNNLQFMNVQQAMAGSAAAHVYVWMILVGFACKAGLWPAHVWLSAAFKSASQLTRVLLGGVPVAMAMIGAIRWLPIGVHSFYVVGTVIQILSVVAMGYALFKLFRVMPITMLPAWSAIAATGLFALLIGTGLAHPVIWGEYAYLAYPYITVMAMMLMLLTWFSGWLLQTGRTPTLTEQPVSALPVWTQEWRIAIRQWARQGWLVLAPLASGVWLKTAQHIVSSRVFPKSVGFAGGWRFAITLFVLLVLLLAWLAA